MTFQEELCPHWVMIHLRQMFTLPPSPDMEDLCSFDIFTKNLKIGLFLVPKSSAAFPTSNHVAFRIFRKGSAS